MIDKMKKVAARVFCHRAIYVALSGSYGAGCFGASSEIVYAAIMACYLWLALRG